MHLQLDSGRASVLGDITVAYSMQCLATAWGLSYVFTAVGVVTWHFCALPNACRVLLPRSFESTVQ
jgi:hypothetical protein